MPAVNITHSHLGVCPCCGSDTARTRGVVERDGIQVAAYLIKWTVGDPSHGMAWLVSLSDPLSRRAVSVSLSYSFEHGSFMVRHVNDYSWAEDDTTGFGELLGRDQVIGTPLAARVFEIVDEIWLSDPYVQDFVAAAKENEH